MLHHSNPEPASRRIWDTLFGCCSDGRRTRQRAWQFFTITAQRLNKPFRQGAPPDWSRALATFPGSSRLRDMYLVTIRQWPADPAPPALVCRAAPTVLMRARRAVHRTHVAPQRKARVGRCQVSRGRSPDRRSGVIGYRFVLAKFRLKDTITYKYSR